MDREYQIKARVPCSNCRGTGFIGGWYCDACGYCLNDPTPTHGCAHPPDKLTDNRRKCKKCDGTGYVDAVLSLSRLAELLILAIDELRPGFFSAKRREQ